MSFIKAIFLAIALILCVGTTLAPRGVTVVSLAITKLPDAPPYDPYAHVDAAELSCMQQNIYFEGRNQTVEGMEAIGLATLNRLVSPKYPDTVCEVITQGLRWKGRIIYRKCQYSWFCDRLPDSPNLKNSIERLAWENSGTVAREVLAGRIDDFTDGATHYHYFDMPTPYWARATSGLLERTIQADDHIFYKMLATAGDNEFL